MTHADANNYDPFYTDEFGTETCPRRPSPARPRGWPFTLEDPFCLDTDLRLAEIANDALAPGTPYRARTRARCKEYILARRGECERMLAEMDVWLSSPASA